MAKSAKPPGKPAKKPAKKRNRRPRKVREAQRIDIAKWTHAGFLDDGTTATGRAIAAKLGLDPSTVSREQKNILKEEAARHEGDAPALYARGVSDLRRAVSLAFAAYEALGADAVASKTSVPLGYLRLIAAASAKLAQLTEKFRDIAEPEEIPEGAFTPETAKDFLSSNLGAGAKVLRIEDFDRPGARRRAS